MKLLFIPFILILVWVYAKSPIPDRLVEIECSRFYEFNNSIYDLSNLKTTKLNLKNSVLFKSCPENKYRFSIGRYGLELTSDSLIEDRYCKFKFVNPSTLKVTNPDYEVSYVDLPNKEIPVEKGIAPITLSDYSGIILIYEFKDSLQYDIYKLNYKGEITHHLKIEHTRLIRENNSESYDRYLSPLDRNQNYLVFTSDNSNKENETTVVINLLNLKFQKYKFRISSVVWNESYGNVNGFVLSPEKKYEENSTLNYFNLRDSSIMSLKIPYASEQCETYLMDNKLYVANYSHISTGCTLHAFDIIKKEKLWTADVIQLMVDHSKYFNKVYLSEFNSKIILEGQEAYGNYLQIFDGISGNRLAAFGDVAKK